MGNFSRDTFDKLKHYVGVRLQQGVPLVDADWNEMEDIRKHELRDFLKNFVGNGVPDGNDGFRVTAGGSLANDFTIKGGDGTEEGAARCLVEGWDVMNNVDLHYTEQELYNNGDLAATWGVAPLMPLTTPAADRTDIVYLDVWEREVTGEEDEDLINQAIGIETCVRLKLEWVVRVLESVPDEATFPTIEIPEGHAFYPLAILKRKHGEDTIPEDSIIDLRLTGLSMGLQNDIKQLGADVYGPDYSLDHDGQPNLKVSLKEALGAVLRGDSPSTPVQRLTTNPATDQTPSALIDSQGDIWVFWVSDRGANNDIYYKRTTNGTWGEESPLPTDRGADAPPSAVIDSQGDIWVFWVSNHAIYYKCYSYSNGTWGNDNTLVLDVHLPIPPSVVSLFAVIDSQGDIWLFFVLSGPYICYKCYSYTDGTWESSFQQLTAYDPDPTDNPSAVIDNEGNIWVFFESYKSEIYDIYYKCYLNGEWGSLTRLTTDPGIDVAPSAVIDNQGDMWVFWESSRSGGGDIYYKRYREGTWGDDTRLATDPGAVERYPSAVVDSQGDIWVFGDADISGNRDIWYKIFTPNYAEINHQMALDIAKNDRQQLAADVYGPDYSLDQDSQPNLKVSLREAINAVLRGDYPTSPPKRLTTDTAVERLPSAVIDSQGDMWVFWNRNYDIYYKRYINAVWDSDTALITAQGDDSGPSAVLEGDANICLFWHSNRDTDYDIYYKRYYIDGGWEEDDHKLTESPSVEDRYPSAVFEAGTDGLWAFWNSRQLIKGYEIFCCRYGSDGWNTPTPLTDRSSDEQYPSAVVDRNGVIWVFWRSDREVGNSHIYYKRCVNGVWETEDKRLTDETGLDHSPSAVIDGQGDIWVFWESKREGTTHDIYYKRYVDGNWGPDRRWISDTQVNLMNPSAVTDPRGDIWVFWRADEAGSSKIYYSTIYLSI